MASNFFALQLRDSTRNPLNNLSWKANREAEAAREYFAGPHCPFISRDKLNNWTFSCVSENWYCQRAPVREPSSVSAWRLYQWRADRRLSSESLMIPIIFTLMHKRLPFLLLIRNSFLRIPLCKTEERKKENNGNKGMACGCHATNSMTLHVAVIIASHGDDLCPMFAFVICVRNVCRTEETIWHCYVIK